ncbi:hypothetical protein FGE12_02210 [Aggregicoccus sp. 17bor-14]|uniref:hypothetical protein n=1 Tax=Myxococcaceae TaxID=31 RepID=UPI00129C55C1|nr:MULTISPECIES: hypothetical protein [Myxococcaceae]MBF5041184.1 hypothetical protein [Simulacricoccus sp. 17bor-14]MRI86971.1 hypothetical protein [Aggregicoccus sp. 17bor-14]
MPLRPALAPLLVLALLAPLRAVAGEPAAAPGSRFELSTEGSSLRLRAGERGVFVLTVKTRGGAHVSDEAPLKLLLQSAQLTPAKTRLGQADSVARKQPGEAYVDPRFEVAFTAPRPGRASLDAQLTFFLCMEERCERMERSVSLPVEVL